MSAIGVMIGFWIVVNVALVVGLLTAGRDRSREDARRKGRRRGRVGGGISEADDDQLVTGRAVSAQHPCRPIRTRRIKRCASFQAVGAAARAAASRAAAGQRAGRDLTRLFLTGAAGAGTP